MQDFFEKIYIYQFCQYAENPGNRSRSDMSEINRIFSRVPDISFLTQLLTGVILLTGINRKYEHFTYQKEKNFFTKEF